MSTITILSRAIGGPPAAHNRLAMTFDTRTRPAHTSVTAIPGSVRSFLGKLTGSNVARRAAMNTAAQRYEAAGRPDLGSTLEAVGGVFAVRHWDDVCDWR